MTELHSICTTIFMITYEIERIVKVIRDYMLKTAKNDLCKRFYIRY